MREFDQEKDWVLKDWCFWTVVVEKTFESLLDSKETKPVSPNEKQSWLLMGRTDAKAEAPILWPSDAKNWLTGKDPDAGKDWRQKEQKTAEEEDEMVRSHCQVNGQKSEQAAGGGEGQANLVCHSPRGRRVSPDLATEQQQGRNRSLHGYLGFRYT